MSLSFLRRRMPRTAAALGAALFALMVSRSVAAPVERMVVLPGHVPAAVAQAQPLGPVSASQPISLTLTLPLRNQTALTDLLRRLYDPKDPLYGQYLTPAQFTASFGPTQADYSSLTAFAQAQGLTVTGTSPNRATLSVSGTAAQVESAFGLGLNQFRSPTDGRTFWAPTNNPVIPASLVGVLTGVVGLSNANLRHTHSHIVPLSNPFSLPGAARFQLPLTTGTGPGGALTPTDIKNVYNLSNVTAANGAALDGSGQTLGLFELDGYAQFDISSYEQFFGLPNVPLQNVRIDGYNGVPGGGEGEVALDIELQIALAPGASKIIVYEAPNTDQGVIDLYTRIATDDAAKEISSSWGLDEIDTGPVGRNAQNFAFEQMAAQGQSMFAAAGDAGAHDSGDFSLSVDDPASEPFVTGVGGTDLTIGQGDTYGSETAWSDPTDVGRGPAGTGGGGGISAVWPIPNYQVGVTGSASSLGSMAARNVPDVSLYGDYDTGGYLITLEDNFYSANGTSAASPLWSAFTALVNQRRSINGQQPIGFMNPALYPIFNTPAYANDFHDVVGDTNGFYPAVTGYDDATGLGSFNGANLISTLAPLPAPAAPLSLKATNGSASVALTWAAGTGAPSTGYNLYRSTSSGGEGSTPYQTGLSSTSYTDTGVTPGTHYYYQVTAANATGESPRSNEVSGTAEALTQIPFSNAGFENGASRPAPWVTTSGVIDNNQVSEAAHAGSWKAWLDGYGVAHTDTLGLQVTIPATANVGTLTFYMHVDTAERSRTVAYDTLQVQVRDLSGNVLGTIPVASNLDAAAGYAQKTVDLSPYLGKACQVVLVGKEDSSLQTSFVVDDFSLFLQ